MKEFTFEDGIRLTESVLSHNGKHLALEYQSKLIIREKVRSIFLINGQKKKKSQVTYYIIIAYVTLYCKGLS